MDDQWAINVKDVSKSFNGRVVVNRLALKVKRGEIFGFLGPNGSGKTTFIRMLCGLLKPDGGEGECLGYDILTQSLLIKRQVGYMTQRFSLYEDLSVEENLRFIARLYEVEHMKDAVAAAIKRLGLVGRSHQLAGTLSGGWKQRVALAACLIHNPQLLLLDEPTAGVDPKARRDFWEQVHQLSAEGITCLVTTHYMDEAERCHRLGYLSYGNLLACGLGSEIIEQRNLTTYSVEGANLSQLSASLAKTPGVEQSIAFGNRLHVSGRNQAALEGALHELKSESRYRLRKVDSTLEDVFINLTADSTDNFGGGAQ